MSFEVVPEAEISDVLEATREGRCVACYGPILTDCATGHEFYCCACDDSDCRSGNRLGNAFAKTVINWFAQDADEWTHGYSGAEQAEFVATLPELFDRLKAAHIAVVDERNDPDVWANQAGGVTLRHHIDMVSNFTAARAREIAAALLAAADDAEDGR